MRPGTVTLSPLTDSDRARLAAGLTPTPLTDLERVALRVMERADPFEQFLAEAGTDHFYGAWKGGSKAAGGGPADAAKALRRVDASKATGKTPYKSSAAFDRDVNKAMTVAGVAHTGEPGTGVVFKTRTGREAVYFGPNGKPAGTIHVGGSTGHRIDLVEVKPSLRGKGIGTAMYDWAQDGGHVDLYAAIGKSHDFTVAGKAFAHTWLTHRVAIEAERAGIQEATTGSRAKYDAAKAALAHVKAAPTSASGMQAPEEDTPVAEAFAAFLAEKGGSDHFYGAWKGGKSKSGGSPEGVKGIPHTDGIDNHPQGAPDVADGHSNNAFRTADPGDRIEVLVAVGKRAQSVRGVITSRTPTSITVNAGGTTHTFDHETMRHMRVTRHGPTGDVAQWFMGASPAPVLAVSHPSTSPFDAHLHRAGVKPGANTWANPIAKATSSIRFELSAREALFEAFIIERGSDDHFYGAWKGGSKSAGGGPAPVAKDVAAASKGLMADAKAGEPGVTKELQGIADATGGRMEGLDQRFKAEKSLNRKIAADMHDKGLTAKEAAAGINDHLRYTMVAKDAKSYTDQYKQAVDGLASKGYKPLTVPKSFWNDGVPPPPVYQGVNAVFVNKAGQRFELQFHTEQSLSAKNAIHGHYETWRASSDPKVRAKEWSAMLAVQSKVKPPSGWPPSGFEFRNLG